MCESLAWRVVCPSVVTWNTLMEVHSQGLSKAGVRCKLHLRINGVQGRSLCQGSGCPRNLPSFEVALARRVLSYEHVRFKDLTCMYAYGTLVLHLRNRY